MADVKPRIAEDSNDKSEIWKLTEISEASQCQSLKLPESMRATKTMTRFMPPPPAATFLAFHPQDNNIIAIGMDDSTIQIYNVRVDEVKSKLKGHSKRFTGLAFSHVLNVLVSSGADAQICVWSSDGWEKQKYNTSNSHQERHHHRSPTLGSSFIMIRFTFLSC
ncbi:CTLH, C-terminal LisH motif-containing protein [Artemisia annua]|uniref:CTLH, C-terminal LisH motif-containing protein n=1 Tax=Artemisia annua TaxID=35608 RepID=A0A2U1KTW7_ARTAN|nr:CTLH, C-terminal LisH motif-containing protein [Artemisia annua]